MRKDIFWVKNCIVLFKPPLSIIVVMGQKSYRLDTPGCVFVATVNTVLQIYNELFTIFFLILFH